MIRYFHPPWRRDKGGWLPASNHRMAYGTKRGLPNSRGTFREDYRGYSGLRLPQLRGYPFGSVYNEDYRVRESILASPSLENYKIRLFVVLVASKMATHTWQNRVGLRRAQHIGHGTFCADWGPYEDHER